MAPRDEADGGFTVLDGAAVVLGAAVASVHLRDLVLRPLTPPGWAMVWVTFTGVALTAAGPFLFLARRVVRRRRGYPRVGDGLWAVLGLPWILTVPVRPPGARAIATRAPTAMALYAGVLWPAIGLACAVAVVVVWKTWILPPPDRTPTPAARPWSDRLGLVLAVAWPLQCGFGLMVAE